MRYVIPLSEMYLQSKDVFERKLKEFLERRLLYSGLWFGSENLKFLISSSLLSFFKRYDPLCYVVEFSLEDRKLSFSFTNENPKIEILRYEDKIEAAAKCYFEEESIKIKMGIEVITTFVFFPDFIFEGIYPLSISRVEVSPPK